MIIGIVASRHLSPTPLKACIAASVRYYNPPSSSKMSHFQIYLFDQSGKKRQVTFGSRDSFGVAWSAGKSGTPGWLTWIEDDTKPGSSHNLYSLIAYNLTSGKRNVLRQGSDMFLDNPMNGTRPDRPVYCVALNVNENSIYKAVKDGQLVGGSDQDDRSDETIKIASPLSDHPGKFVQRATNLPELTFAGKPYDLSTILGGTLYLKPFDFGSKVVLSSWDHNSTTGATTCLYLLDWKSQSVKELFGGNQLDWKMGRTLWAYTTNRDLSDYGKKTVWTSQLYLVNSDTWAKKELVSGLAWVGSMAVLPQPDTVK